MTRTHLDRLTAFSRSRAAVAIAGLIASLSSSRIVAGQDRPATFTKDIAPIVFERCGGCHRPGGTAPFSLLTYADVRPRAARIASVTKSRLMPPWKAEPGYGEFVGRQPLADEEIAAIQRWVDDGAREGSARDLPPLPHWVDGWQLGTPDLVVTSQTYTLPAKGDDAFHVFVVPIPIGAVRYVRGVEFRPDNARVVHHANILLDRTPTSRERNEQDPTLGEQGLLAATAAYPPGHFLGWTPGPPDPLLPKRLSWRLEPGTDLVVQLHLKPGGTPQPVRFSVGFFFGADPPSRTPAVLRLGRQDIDIPAGEARYTITDSYVLPVDADVLALKPHAHYRAHDVRVLATRPNGATTWLLYIKDWDFGWQHTYRYVTPVALPRGTRVTMEYTYDNSVGQRRNPQQPPRRTRWGPRSSDEMGDLWMQLLTRDDRDLATLNGDFRKKWAAEDAVGYESLLAADPGNVTLHEDAAVVYLELGRAEEAVTHLNAAVRLKPASAPAHVNLGVALMRAGRSADAIREYEEALRLDPGFAAAHTSLGNALAERGQLNGALAHYREAVRLEPTRAAAHNNIGFILLSEGKLDEALPYFREALRIDPQSADAGYNIGLVLEARGVVAEAIQRYRQALEVKPDWPVAMARLAWVLATTADGRLRDPDQAVRLAERAAALTARRDAETLDVLGAAYASAGQFDRALEVVDEGLRVPSASPIAAGLRARQALYRRRQPFRQP